MADITLRLIWYRLGEVREKMAETGRTWYTELDFDSYVLDLLLLGWCTLCFIVILAVNAIVAAFGPLQRQPREKFRETKDGEISLTGAVLQLETAQWFNSAVNWFYLHYYHAPEFVDEWVKSLNEQVVKLGGPVQCKFERIQSGSLPPKVTHVSCEASPQDRFIIHAKLESRDLSFVVFASQQTHEGVKLTNCTANVLRLKGTLRIQSYREGADVKVSFNFEGKPEIQVQVKPLNPYQDANELVDLGVVEANVRNSMILAKTTVTVTHLLMPGDLHTVNHDFGGHGHDKGGQDQGKGSNLPRPSPQPDTYNQQKPKPASPSSAPQQAPPQQQKLQEDVSEEIVVSAVIPTNNKAPPIHSISVQNEPVQSIPIYPVSRQAQQQQIQQQLQHQLQQEIKQVPRRDQQRVRPQSRPEGVFEPVEALNLSSSLYTPSAPKPVRMVGDKRLLVKVIKANGLHLKEVVGAANIVCMLSTDEPVQGYSTSVVKNTQNPFWDEHFLFDITQETQEVRVEVYDKDKPNGDEFIGEAIVYVEDLRKTPSSRQILRLHPQPENFEYNVGTVTAEFLFMDPAEADLLLDSMTTTSNNQLSPRRRIEIAQTVTPGGTVVTKTTTTTQKPQYGRHDPGLDGSPNYIEKNVYAEESPRLSYNETPSNFSSEPKINNGQDTRGNLSLTAAALRDIQDRSWRPRSHAKSSTIIITGVKRTIESPPLEDTMDVSNQHQLNQQYNQQPQPIALKDDLELVRPQLNDTDAEPSPNLKKSRTLGGSLKKLFRRSRKQSRTRGDSRESSMSRGSRSKGPSRDSSLTRQSQRENELRASSVS